MERQRWAHLEVNQRWTPQQQTPVWMPSLFSYKAQWCPSTTTLHFLPALMSLTTLLKEVLNHITFSLIASLPLGPPTGLKNHFATYSALSYCFVLCHYSFLSICLLPTYQCYHPNILSLHLYSTPQHMPLLPKTIWMESYHRDGIIPHHTIGIIP
jgi:hypothetical protein